jgi:cell division septum initiation protein DivIVA
VAIKDYNIVQAEMDARIDSLRQVVADLDSSKRTLQEAMVQAEASIKSSRDRVGAFIGDQANHGRDPQSRGT